MLYNIFKQFALRLDPEWVHDHTIKFMNAHPELAYFFGKKDPSDRFNVDLGEGLIWSFPIGLAAGLDKNALAIDFFSRLGFGAVEVGTVTPIGQIGNPRPRIWRYKNEESLRNAMGFPNDGLEIIKSRLSQNYSTCVGGNIGKNKETPAEHAPKDYTKLYKELAPHCDYLVINVSSPNTPGLRDLQSKAAMEEILQEMQDERRRCQKPLFLKISPDVAFEQLEDFVQLSQDFNLCGIVATNTTIMPERGKGGVSGRLLLEKSGLIRKQLLEMTQDIPEIEIIGVGGISKAQDLFEFWKNGGKAAQIYTGFIYNGPGVLGQFQQKIECFLDLYNLKSLSEFFALDFSERKSLCGSFSF